MKLEAIQNLVARAELKDEEGWIPASGELRKLRNWLQGARNDLTKAAELIEKLDPNKAQLLSVALRGWEKVFAGKL